MSCSLFDHLPDNVVLELVGKSCGESLRSWELVCKRFRTLIVEYQVWRQRCAQLEQLIGLEFSSVKVSCRELKAEVQGVLPNLQQQNYLSSLLFKRLFAVLQTRVNSYSLVLDGIYATSTDHEHENIHNTVTLNHFRPVDQQLSAYWSSTGSCDPKITDTLTYCLAHPLCIVRQVQMRPFRAFFQPGFPIYAPSLIRMRACNSRHQQFFDEQGNCREISELENQFRDERARQIQQQHENKVQDSTYKSVEQELPQTDFYPELLNSVVSEVFPARKSNVLQQFQLSKPIVCIGGTVQLDLIGRTQIQEGIDDKYYNCLAVARFVGDPIYNFRICYDSQGDMVLTYWGADSLLESGGLNALAANTYAQDDENNQFPLWFQVNNQQVALQDMFGEEAQEMEEEEEIDL